MIENLASDGINTDYIFTEKGVNSGTALIMIGEDGDNYLSVSPGANYRLSPAHIENVKLIAGAEIIILQYEIPEETIAPSSRKPMSIKYRVMWNFAPAREIDSSLLTKVDFLVVNEVEAAFLTGGDKDMEEAATDLLARESNTVIITLGASGSYIACSRFTGKKFLPTRYRLWILPPQEMYTADVWLQLLLKGNRSMRL